MFHRALGGTWIITGQIKAPQGSRGLEETFTSIENFKNVNILHTVDWKADIQYKLLLNQ